MSDVFDSVVERVDELAQIMELNDKEKEILLSSHQIRKAELEVDGEKLPAWRIISNNALGPGKGGIRFHPDVTEGEVKSLAFWMALKNSLTGLPYGGGKGGVRFNPKGKDKKYLEKVSRAYARAFAEYIGEDKDIPAPDVYTNSETMAWILDEYEKIIGAHQPAVITGKPIELGGSALRGDATAHGGFIVFNELIESQGVDRKKIKVAVQGFGNAGSHLARMLDDAGIRVVAVSDSSTGLYDKAGLNIKKVLNDKLELGELVKSKEGDKITNNQLLALPVDVLFLAALENQVTHHNADQVQASYIIEIANGPVSPEADRILWGRRVIVVPDILANAGGVVVSYFEWAQNKSGNLFDDEYLEKKLEKIMKSAWQRVYYLHQEKKDFDLRTCAYILAIKRILAAERLRGRVGYA